jgi:hypothetical protein
LWQVQAKIIFMYYLKGHYSMSYVNKLTARYVLAKKFSEEEQDALVQELKKKFGSKFWVKPGSEWREGAVLWSGEGAYMPNGDPAFNSYGFEQDPEEKIWQMGVHKDLEKWAKSKGLFWESYDAGTYLAYPI